MGGAAACTMPAVVSPSVLSVTDMTTRIDREAIFGTDTDDYAKLSVDIFLRKHAVDFKKQLKSHLKTAAKVSGPGDKNQEKYRSIFLFL